MGPGSRFAWPGRQNGSIQFSSKPKSKFDPQGSEGAVCIPRVRPDPHLPVQRPTKFEFAVNLKAAKALNFVVPPAVLALADEVFE